MQQLHFSPSTQAFYELSLDYQDLPDDLIEIGENTHAHLLSKINEGYHINADLSLSDPRPSHRHTWQEGKWVLDVEKSVLQEEIWEAIKQKRHTITRSGVYIASVDKWFHTDDSSRTQYLALQILPQLPENLMWKTMDNSFVQLDKALLTELTMTILATEQADFVNAERHKVAMMRLDNPLDYDYSTGWRTVYQPRQHGVSDD